MRRKGLMVALCWLTFSGTSAKFVQTAYGVGLIDNISAESAPRLYKDVPVGVYASATPYAAYSFNAPTFIEPKNGQVVPVKEESVVVRDTNGFLKDSYGQRFVEAPQTIAYKAIFPQQFVELQNLPAHLSQPLAAASNFQYGQGTPHFFQQSQFRTPSLQSLAPSNVHQFTSSQPFTFSNNLRGFSPSPFTSQVQGHPLAQQQSSSNKNVYINNLTSDHYSKLQNQPKFQRLQEGPTAHNNNNKQSQAQNAQLKQLQLVHVPEKTSITTVTNGKKTVVNFLTKPPVPLLDLTLLEPLTFDNPLVPQVQHFLPRINQVKYKKLPEIIQDTYNDSPEVDDVDEVQKHQMEFIVQNTKTYDSGVVDAKNGSPKKKQKQPPQHEEIDEIEVHPTPTVTIHDAPEISYEINSPNYKETVSEKKISYKKKTGSEPVNVVYNKKTDHEPVHYSYEQRTEKKPIHYSYTSSSKEPYKPKKTYAQIIDDQPRQLIYHFNDEEKRDHESNQQDNSAPVENEAERSSDKNSEETDAEEALQQNEQDDERREHYEESPKTYHPQPEHREQHEAYQPNENDESADLRKEPPRQVSQEPPQNEQQFQPIVPEYEEDITILPTHKPHAPSAPEHQQKHHHNYEINHDNKHHQNHKPNHGPEHHQHHHHSNKPAHGPEHYQDREHRNKPAHGPGHYQDHHHSNKPAHGPEHYQDRHHSNKPTHGPEHYEDRHHSKKPNHSPEHHQDGHHDNKHNHEPQHEQQNYDYPKSHYSSSPEEQDKSQRITVKEGTTAEVYQPNEKLIEQMVKKQEESEEDFEKAYKNAAIGFPAYNAPFVDVEREIYNPDSYGSARYTKEYNVEKSPLRQYEAEGDDYPKYTRSEYKDARDKTMDDYFLDYSVSRPESLAERHKNKENYYEVYTQHKPANYFSKEKNKENPKHTASSLQRYYAKPQQKQQLSKYRIAPKYEGYNYKKEAPHDSSAYATRPLQLYKLKTQFVEPQYQYGFEPLAIPRLLDSELAAMASNHSPESERPGTRLKNHKANRHNKKTNLKTGS